MANKNTKKSAPAAPAALIGAALTDAERQLVVKTVMNNTAIVLGGTRFAEIDPNCLSIEYGYQRSLSMSKVRAIAENWDPCKAGVITCSHRNGKLYALDGQHRTVAACLAGIPTVAVQILTGLTAQEEALLFANQDDNKSKVSNIAKYKANLFAGTSYAVKLNDMLTTYGLKLATGHDKTKEAGCINCTAALQTVVLSPSYGFDCLAWILSTFKSATWLGSQNAMITKHITNMASVWREGVTDNTLDDYTKNLISFLSGVTPDGFQALASHAFPHLSDHRASNRSMFYAVARGTITLTNPIINEVFGSDDKD